MNKEKQELTRTNDKVYEKKVLYRITWRAIPTLCLAIKSIPKSLDAGCR